MSVCIKLTDEYRLTTDPYNWIIQKFSHVRKDGTERWNAVGFYASPKYALNGLYATLLRDADASTLVQLKETAESIAGGLLQAYADSIEMSEDIVSKRKSAVLDSLEVIQPGIRGLLG